jgi:uncharacterized membrane protein YfcA
LARDLRKKKRKKGKETAMKRGIVAKKEKESLLRVARLSLTGLLAGVANGLLGAGGGIIAAFGLLREYRGDLEPKDAYAGALSVMLPLSLLSFLRYLGAGALSSAPPLGIYLVPALLGGASGALLLARLGNRALRRLFGILVVWSGILLIIR